MIKMDFQHKKKLLQNKGISSVSSTHLYMWPSNVVGAVPSEEGEGEERGGGPTCEGGQGDLLH